MANLIARAQRPTLVLAPNKSPPRPPPRPPPPLRLDTSARNHLLGPEGDAPPGAGAPLLHKTVAVADSLTHCWSHLSCIARRRPFR
jgi:hypothetical protein